MRHGKRPDCLLGPTGPAGGPRLYLNCGTLIGQKQAKAKAFILRDRQPRENGIADG
jgi:hypothetical protein